VVLGETWEIWVHVQGVQRAGAIHIVNTATIDALCDRIQDKFRLSERIADWVVKGPHESLLANADPKSVDPSTFKQNLDEPEATLATVLKPAITKGKYRVYVELPAKPQGAAGTNGSFNFTPLFIIELL